MAGEWKIKVRFDGKILFETEVEAAGGINDTDKAIQTGIKRGIDTMSDRSTQIKNAEAWFHGLEDDVERHMKTSIGMSVEEVATLTESELIDRICKGKQ